MTDYQFSFHGTALTACASGALWWPEEALLCVSDLHLGKSERIRRREDRLLPPYDSTDTLQRLDQLIATHAPRTVVCLGDSFDDIAVLDAMHDQERLWITRMQAGRRWVWIEGNHDPGPVELGGQHLLEYAHGGLMFRHIAQEVSEGEISGHYHPKARIKIRGRMVSKPAFLVDERRIILPAFGTYTGGLDCISAPLAGVMQSDALAILTGTVATPVPMPR